MNPIRIVLVIPIFDDWESAAMLCALIEKAFIELPAYTVTVVLVDDGSFRSDEAMRVIRTWTAIHEIHVLRLRRNMGHQRAIAIGLAWVQQNMPCDFVVIMDGDGEDLPKDIPALVARCAEAPSGQIVFAERGRRMEGTLFRGLYLAYRSAHRLITGRGIRFGNFSAIPFGFLKRLTVMSEVWGHYAAAVINARIPFATVRVDRGARLAGTTKMNLESLVLHGLAAVAVYQTVSVRVLIGSSLLSALLFLSGLGIVIARAVTGHAFPGGTTTILGICLILICLITFNSVLYVFTALAFRHLTSVLPARDYVYFVDSCERIYPE
jgi:glycosyltransferase involved in cell wall biosynthesis